MNSIITPLILLMILRGFEKQTDIYVLSCHGALGIGQDASQCQIVVKVSDRGRKIMLKEMRLSTHFLDHKHK